MKKNFTFLLFQLIVINSFAQATLAENEKLSSLCHVWGFLKYYHPTVAKGKLDWDLELRKNIQKIKPVKTKEELSAFYLEWINSLGEIPPCKKCDQAVPSNHFEKNFDLNWINNNGVFTDVLSQKLNYILKNRNQENNFYVDKAPFIGNCTFKNEQQYNDSIYPSAELRLIGLFRYWNIINYFFPYKYLMDQDWNTTLTEMIPKFNDAKNVLEYHFAMKELVAKLNDGHAQFMTYHLFNCFWAKWPSFQTKIIESKLLVTYIYNDSLAKMDDVRYGDVILKVNNKPISEIIDERKKYTGASNESAQLSYISHLILNDSADAIQITYDRDGLVSTKTIHLFTNKVIKVKWYPNDQPLSSKIDGDIGYINMEKLKMKDVKKVMIPLFSCKGIILDLRGYPNGTYRKISKYLNMENVPFVKFTKPMPEYPGLFKDGGSYYTGKSKRKCYKGKVVILINEETQSHAEFSTMALMKANNTVIIGSNTAGADGNISTVMFPGGFKTSFSGIGVYFPDGSETQRIGIIPTIKINPTIDGLRNKKDELMERAIEYIKTGN